MTQSGIPNSVLLPFQSKLTFSHVIRKSDFKHNFISVCYLRLIQMLQLITKWYLIGWGVRRPKYFTIYYRSNNAKNVPIWWRLHAPGTSQGILREKCARVWEPCWRSISYSFMLKEPVVLKWCTKYRRGAPLFSQVIHQISRSRGLKIFWFGSNLNKITRPVAANKSLRDALSFLLLKRVSEFRDIAGTGTSI